MIKVVIAFLELVMAVNTAVMVSKLKKKKTLGDSHWSNHACYRGKTEVTSLIIGVMRAVMASV